jgi:integrase/recombinase XerD
VSGAHDKAADNRESQVYLARWKTDYPGEANAQASVFITSWKDPITYGSFEKQLQRLTKRAGFKKNITPNIFRHCRITDLVRQGVPESVENLVHFIGPER